MANSLLVGTAGWSFEDWKGIVYPPDAGRDFKPLRYIADFYDCIEVNSSFYRIPAKKMMQSILALAAHKPGFTFCVKLFQGFTHGAGKSLDKEAVAAFRTGIEPLLAANKLGAVLVQFPWSFRFDAAAREWVKKVAAAFPEVNKVLEVRHISWGTEEAFSFMRDTGLNFCNIDQPASKTGIPPTTVLTGRTGYVRLHGRNSENWFKKDAGRDARYDYYYSFKELDEWVVRIKELAARADTLFVITNNHYRGQGAANALQLMSRLLGKKVPVPAPMLEHFPELKDING
ncbi:MAG: DUF72 domain-containing protein [Planctomycetota bacterium]|nr:DUF72 domain-containing protein [Planctomycetota bacterium]